MMQFSAQKYPHFVAYLQLVNNDYVIFQFLFTSCWGICQYLSHP